MNYQLSFRQWTEGWQDFGFPDDRPTKKDAVNEPETQEPINGFNLEYLRDMLVERSIGPLQPQSHFVNEVVWGDYQMGSIRCRSNPQLGVALERLGIDLQGEPRWYCKKYYQINREGFGGHEPTVTQEIYQQLHRVYEEPPESPKNEVEDFENLVLFIAERMRKVMRPVFMMEQIRRATDHRYIICCNVRGNGVQSPGQHQVFRNLTEVSFLSNEGVIRIFNQNVHSKVGRGRSLQFDQSDADFVFFPTQSRDEIADPIATKLRFY